MKLQFNKENRKELVRTLAGILEVKSKYLGAPSMAYEVGAFTLTRDGELSWDEMDFPTGIDQILQDLERSGIEPVRTAEDAQDEPTTETLKAQDFDGLTIEMPREKFTDEAIENLKKIAESKAGLFKKAFEADELPILVTDEKVSFPWFRLAEPEAVKAYTHFITAISEMATTQKRVTATEKDVDNDKYAFRCFLLRLGFIGQEYKEERKVLLKNLTGSSAFKSGSKGGAQ